MELNECYQVQFNKNDHKFYRVFYSKFKQVFKFFQVHQVLTKLTIKKLINLNLTNEMIKNLINLLFSVFALDLSFYNSY